MHKIMRSNKSEEIDRVITVNCYADLESTLYTASLSAAILVTSATGTMLTPAFAQGENMTDGGNYTDGNMTGSGMAGSGVTTPPIIAPKSYRY